MKFVIFLAFILGTNLSFAEDRGFQYFFGQINYGALLGQFSAGSSSQVESYRRISAQLTADALAQQGFNETEIVGILEDALGMVFFNASQKLRKLSYLAKFAR